MCTRTHGHPSVDGLTQAKDPDRLLDFEWPEFFSVFCAAFEFHMHQLFLSCGFEQKRVTGTGKDKPATLLDI